MVKQTFKARNLNHRMYKKDGVWMLICLNTYGEIKFKNTGKCPMCRELIR